jgi:heptosyltransferase-2
MGAGPERPRRILVRLPNWLGDALMATPALRALREAHPQAELALEGPPAFEVLLRGGPGFDSYLPDAGRRTPLRERVRRLRAGRFDWAVLLADSARTALGPWLARIPRRVGYARDALRRALLTDPLAPPRAGARRLPLPMVQRYLRIVAAVGCPARGTALALAVEPAAAARLAERLAGRGLAGSRLATVTPGASFGASKLWPPAAFAEACDALTDRLGLVPVLAPAPAEVTLARSVAAAMRRPAPVLDDPPTSLEELAALVARSALLLTNDTGPRQLAVALGTPAVVLMGPTDPRHTAVNLERQRVLREEVGCSPCHLKRCPTDHRCMARLSPARVLAAAAELLA